MLKNKIRVLVNGASGRMGKEAVAAINEDANLELVGTSGRYDDLSDGITNTKPDVVVDFTQPHCAYINAKTIIAANCHPVIGTTGLTETEIEELVNECAEKKLGGVIAPNFSLGAVMLMLCAQKVAKYFPDAEIIEAHGPHKVDAPSGTAIKTAKMIAAARNIKNVSASTATKTGEQNHSRGDVHSGVQVHAMRLPGFTAMETVVFGGKSETLTIQHQSTDRSSFMPGLLLACHKAPTLNTLHYGLEHLLEI